MQSTDINAASPGQMDPDNQARQTGKTCGSCGDSSCSTTQRDLEEKAAEFAERVKLQARLGNIKVGKSTVATNLAIALMQAGKKVGLLDVDIHGPSIPTMLGLEGQTIRGEGEDLLPVDVGGFKVMSIGFLLRNPDDAIICRGPMKIMVIKQFLRDVAWGELDFLIIDSPPGTGDVPLTVCQLIEELDGAVIVTTPQKIATIDVRKSISFCRELKVPILGVVENMSGFACPKCGEITQVLSAGGGRGIAEDMHVPFLGAIPMDPMVAEACDSGRTFIRHYAESPTAKIMQDIIAPIAALDREKTKTAQTTQEQTVQPAPNKANGHKRIVIPLADGKLTSNFGHCPAFALVDVDLTDKTIIKREDIEAPPHEPGLLPPWLTERGADLIIAGGMGQRAKQLFIEQGIEVLVGAQPDTPEKLANNYMTGSLKLGENACDH